MRQFNGTHNIFFIFLWRISENNIVNFTKYAAFLFFLSMQDSFCKKINVCLEISVNKSNRQIYIDILVPSDDLSDSCVCVINFQ